jgi:prepilin-type N-terminal cleavage/methylation domain-containing protein
MKRHGFTLVEVMMVVVVAAILFVAAMPDQAAVESQRGRNLATQLEADIAYAQSRSIANPVDPTVLRVDPVNNKYWLAKLSDTSAPIANRRTGGAYVVNTGSNGAYAGVDIIGVDFNGDDALRFDGTGTIDQDVDALIQIQSGSAKYEVVVTHTTGRSSTKSTLTKSIPRDSVAVATGVTRDVGNDAGVTARETDARGESTNGAGNGADSGDDGGLLDGVLDLVNGLLGGR